MHSLTTTQPPDSMLAVAQRVRELDRGRRMSDVRDRLEAIEHATGRLDGRPRPRHPDGVACFNTMYLRVTRDVEAALPCFEAPEFLERLGVVFAEFYLDAYDAACAGAWVSKAWEPLFEQRRSRRVAPIQFALAGMNAHINNDLPWALLQTWEELDLAPSFDSPEWRDYQRIDAVLDRAAHGIRALLEHGLLTWLDRHLGRADDLFASFVVDKAREEAWRRGARWRARFDAGAAEGHERHVGFESHLILAA